MPVVAFLSDYGLRDEFVGVCKGVMLSIAPGLQILHDELLYNQLFTMHGTVMIFLFIIPVLVGFGIRLATEHR